MNYKKICKEADISEFISVSITDVSVEVPDVYLPNTNLESCF
jgi:hypothetical protein